MSVLFVFRGPIIPYVGGIQRVIHLLATELQKRGYYVNFLSYTRSSEEYDTVAPQFYIELSELSANNKFEAYRDLLNRLEVDVVIFLENDSNDLFLLNSTPVGVKRVVCCHAQPLYMVGNARHFIINNKQTSYFKRILAFLYYLFPFIYERRAISRMRQQLLDIFAVCDYYCLLSERFIHRILTYIPNIDIRKIRAINNPISIQSLEIDCEQSKENALLWVGRVRDAEKNLKGFLKFWEQFYKSHPEWKAYIVGTGPDLENNIKYAERRSLKNLSFEGRRKDVVCYYNKCRFLCCTSITEGWGMAIVEAMTQGCVPCAYSTYESLHDIISDGEDGIIVKPSCIKDLIEKMDLYISSPSEYERLSKNAKEKVKSFSIDIIADQWEKMLKS